VGDRLGHLKDHRLLTQPTDVLLLIQACLQVRPVILPIQATVATHHHPTIDPMLDPTPAVVEATLHLRIPQDRDQVGHPIRVMGRHPPMVALHPQTMRRPQERITDRVTMVRDLADPVTHRVAPNLGPHRPPLVHRLLRQRLAVVARPMLLVAHLQTKIFMDNSRHITISISLNLDNQDNSKVAHLDRPQDPRDLFSRPLRILRRNPQGLQTLHLQLRRRDHLKQPRRYLHR
jgi:hypothetical protein